MLETNSTKTTAAEESNNAGVWGRNPQPPVVKGSLAAEPPNAAAFFQLFLKKNAF